MIRILDSSLRRIGIITKTLDASWTEELNGVNNLDFHAMLTPKLNALINDDSIFEVEGNYFDLMFYSRGIESEGMQGIEVEAEHISHRLNNPDFDVEYFTEYGTVSDILSKILEGTGFIAGPTDFTDVLTYSAQEPKSRRQILMEFVATVYGEIQYNNFEISIVKHRGSTDPKPAITGRNINTLSKTVNKREKDEEGNPIVSYVCSPINLPDNGYNLGDEILMLHKELGIKEKLRLVSISRDPYNAQNTTMQFTNYENGLESELYRIETEQMVKDRLYNGIRIGPKYGFEAIRNDKHARAYFRSDGLVMQSGDGTGTDDSWRDRLYYEYDSDADETTLVFDGKLSVDLLESVSGIVTPFIYADNGMISNLTVRRLRTDLSKPFHYLEGNKEDIHFQDIGDTDELSGRYFEVDYCFPDRDPVQFSIPSIDGLTINAIPLWWYEGVEGGAMTVKPEYAIGPDSPDPVPVMTYAYENSIRHRTELKKTPEGHWGIRDQWGGGEDEFGRGAGIIEKTAEYMQMIMDPGVGSEIGGIRISVGKGVELYDWHTKRWSTAKNYGQLTSLDYFDDGFRVNDNFDFQWVEGGMLRMNDDTFIPIKEVGGSISG